MNFRLCWLVGHNKKHNDCGFPVCSCGAHGMFDQDDWKWLGISGYISTYIFRAPITFFEDVIKPNFKVCSECGKLEYRFGKYVGDHSNCLPF